MLKERAPSGDIGGIGAAERSRVDQRDRLSSQMHSDAVMPPVSRAVSSLQFNKSER
jgi:hypothetical protein